MANGIRALALTVALGLPGAVLADGDTGHTGHAGGSRAIDHVPIGVVGEHNHGAGEFMLSYRFMFMSMKGNRDGTERVSTADVLTEFPVSPTAMDMEMHMFGLMWAPTDRLTLMAMVPYLRLDMDHRTGMGGSFTTRSDGFGDLSLSGIYELYGGEQHQLLLNLGMSGPTGTLRAADNLPPTMGERVKLPYPMQIGSGTPDLLPGLTWNGDFGRVRLGTQVRGVYRIGRNREGYRLGHRFAATGWAAVELCRSVSASLRFSFDKWKDIVGDDDDLNGDTVPTADPSLRAGRRVDAALGLNYLVGSGPLKGHRFAIEVARPIHQILDGPQLETDWLTTAGWQLAF
ncbi:MAG: transporter [Deltaproteobacteria bacterium]|nr:transporter [Deltaproteobacteria bacterium]